MVNTLSGSVCAYRKETVKPRFIRIDEVMALLDVTQDEAMDIALAAGARYQLAKIILVHKERLMKFMKHSARVPSSNKIVEKKFVRIGEGSMTYSIGHHRFIEMARAAGAVYKIGEAKGNTILINLEVFDEYMEQFREPPTEMKHTSFFTDEDGDLILPEALKIGNYRIEEVSAPFGYVVNDKYVNISVDTDTAFETDGDTNDAIITVEYSDAPAVGELTVEKKGEVLDGFKGGLLASSYEKEFVYKEGSLAGAKFKVYAAEDIYTADNQKDADGNRIKYYSKGDLVTTLTTGKDGKATAKNLPLGQYRVVEVEAPYGYVLNPNEQKVTFTYVDDKTPVIKESLTFSDDRQKLDMSVTKLDAEDNTPIAGAVFGLYADEDIKNADGRVIIEKGTLLEKATSDENGKIAFVKDYPFAKYVARELVKPAGYVTNEEAVNFDTKYQGQDVKTAVYNSEYKNTPTTFEFTKTDITSGAELTGATLTVLDNTKVVFAGMDVTNERQKVQITVTKTDLETKEYVLLLRGY